VCVGEFWRPLVEMMASARPDSRDLVALVGDADGLDRFFPPQGPA